MIRAIVNTLKFLAVPVLISVFMVGIASIPMACTKHEQTTVKNDAGGCIKAVEPGLLTRIVIAASAPDWQTQLETIGADVTESLVVCAAKDVLAVITAAHAGSGASTSQPEPLVLHLQSYVASKSK